MSTPITEAAEAYEAQGFAVVRHLLDATTITAQSSEAERILARWMAESHSRYVEDRLVNMHGLTWAHYFDDAAQRIRFFELIAPARLTALLDGMFGAGLYFHNTQLFFNPHGNGRLPYWHRDLQYSFVDDEDQAREQGRMLSLHVRIPLLPEQGVEVIPGSHRRWDTELESDVRWESNHHANSEDLPGSVLIDLAPGDILIFDAQMLHRGNYALNRERRALDLCVGRPHPFTTPYLDEAALPSDDEIDRIANNAWYRRARELATAARSGKARA